MKGESVPQQVMMSSPRFANVRENWNFNLGIGKYSFGYISLTEWWEKALFSILFLIVGFLIIRRLIIGRWL